MRVHHEVQILAHGLRPIYTIRAVVEAGSRCRIQCRPRPLSDAARAAFDVEAAWKFFRDDALGMLYGFSNQLMGWLDTTTGNYPCVPPDYEYCLEPELVEVGFPLVTQKVPSAASVILDSLNKRVGNPPDETLLDFATVYMKSGMELKKNFTELVNIVEKDSWVYNRTRNGEQTIGPSWVCDVLVCMIWKKGGLFKNMFNLEDDEINCTEQTNLDVYGMTVFNSSFELPSACYSRGEPGRKYCQLTGDYEMHLDVNQWKPYRHYGENCPSLDPKYVRPAGC